MDRTRKEILNKLRKLMTMARLLCLFIFVSIGTLIILRFIRSTLCDLYNIGIYISRSLLLDEIKDNQKGMNGGVSFC